MPRPQLAGMKQGRVSRTLDSSSPPTPGSTTPSQVTIPHPYHSLGVADSEMMPPPPNVPHCMSDMLPRAPLPPPPPPAAHNPANVITTSIDEGVEADIMDRDNDAADSASSRFAALQRDPYGLGLLPEYGYGGYGYLDSGNYPSLGHRQSLSSANSSSSLNAAGLGNTLSPFTSFDSSLEVDVSPISGANLPEQVSPRGRSAHYSAAGGMPITTMTPGSHSAYLQVRNLCLIKGGMRCVLLSFVLSGI